MSKAYSMVAGVFIGWGTSIGLDSEEYLLMFVYYCVAAMFIWLSYLAFRHRQALQELDDSFKRMAAESAADFERISQSFQETMAKQELHIHPQLQLPDLREKPVERNTCFRYPEQDPSCRLN